MVPEELTNEWSCYYIIGQVGKCDRSFNPSYESKVYLGTIQTDFDDRGTNHFLND